MEEVTRALDKNFQTLVSKNNANTENCHQSFPTTSVSARHILIAHASTNSSSKFSVLQTPNTSGNSTEFAGFLYLAKQMNLVHHTTPLLIPRLEVHGKKETTNIQVHFVSDNTPLDGWRKVVCLRNNVKTKGKLDVMFERHCNGNDIQRCLNRFDVQKLLEEKQGHLKEKFDFRNVFCVCQTPEDPTRSYLECSFGQSGCNKWVHPECVGLASRSEEELQQLPTIICPFCTTYLSGANMPMLDSLVKNGVRALTEITPGFMQNNICTGDFEIEESNVPHHTWGLERSGCYFQPTDAISRPLLDEHNVVARLLLDEEARDTLLNLSIDTISHSKSRCVSLPNVLSILSSVASINGVVGLETVKNVLGEETQLESQNIDVPPAKKRRALILSGDKKLSVGLTGGYLFLDCSLPAYAQEPFRRIVDMQNHNFPRILSTHDAVMFHEVLLNNSQDLGRSRKRLSGNISTRLEAGESAAAFAVTAPLDGGIAAVSISGCPFSTSLHTSCEHSLYCGFCFETFNDKNEKERISLGASHYPLHKHCKFLADNNIFLSSEKSALRTLSLLHHDKVNDAFCDLCGRSGGLLVRFELSPIVTTMIPPAESFWVGHIPCMRFLQLSLTLDSLQNFHEQRPSVTVGSHDHQFERSSVFDKIFNKNRCRLCNGSQGIVLRCCGMSCSARAHPLCASLTKSWHIVDFELGKVQKSALTLLCEMHFSDN